jgi:hypothetical protein
MSSLTSLPRISSLAPAWALTLLTVLTAPLSAQDHPHPVGERLGTVHFETSCAPAVAPEFDRAVALLHSFEFGASIQSFNNVLASDPACAMAHWGLALSRWSNPMAPGIRAPQALEPGRQAALAAARAASRATERERDYIAAAGRLYESYETRDQQTRVVAYADAMRALSEKHTADTEAKIFYAIALTASASPNDKTYANQLRAGAILEEIFQRQPDHPGLAHYIIHAYDVPALAPQARAAALRYAEIAPSAAHALHMPSHTFTRVGLWQESVETNLRSMEVAESNAAISEALHAADYAVYAYLQMRNDAAARGLLARVPELARRFDPTAVTGAAPPSAGFFGIAAIPARYALERREWAEAVALSPTASPVPYADALTHFARALGGARVGNQALARASIDSLAVLRDRLASRNEAYWADQVDIQRLGASAWLELAASRSEQALALMREAAAREDATEKAAVTPGPLAPARELLGDMLMELGRPAEALAEYRTGLTREPNRYRTLEGARQAAAAAGDRAAAAEFERQLAALRGGGIR